MAQIVLKIKANDGADVLATFTADKIVNNVSTLIGGKTTQNNGVNGKTFATGFLSLKDGFLGGKDTKLQSEVEKYNGFMFGVTDDTGSYDLKLSLEGQNLDKIVIVGDNEANQFPVRAILDEGTEYEKTVYSDDSNWAIAFENESSTHTIRFIKWNRENYNACFTTLKVMVEYLEMDKGWVDSVESLTQSTSDPSSIQYGVLANSGSANIRDLNGELREYVEDGVLENSNVPVELFVNGNKIQEHITTDSDYSQQDKMLNLNFSNKLSKLNDRYLISNFMEYQKTLYDIFVYVMSNLGYSNNEIDDMIKEPVIYAKSKIGTIKNYMENIIVNYPYFNNNTYLEVLNKICTIIQANLILFDNGNIILKNARPLIFKEQSKDAIKINKYNQLKDFNYTIIVKNKYDGINIDEINIGTTLNDNIFASDKLRCCDDKTYIGNNAGINSSIYDVYGDIFDYIHWFQFNYDLDLSQIDKLFYKDLSTLKLSCTFNYNNYNYKNNAYTEDEVPNTSETVELKFYNGEIPYHEWTSAYIDGQHVTNNFFTAQLEGNILHIRGQIEWATDIGNLIITGKNYNVKFLQNFTFNLLKSTFSETSSNIKTGTNNFDITKNELLQSDTICKNLKISDIIDYNIKKDYKNGVLSGNTEIFCTNMFSQDGTKIKNWGNGEILDIGDIVYFENDFTSKGEQRYWKITGRNFIYNGSPTLQLELQNVNFVQSEEEKTILNKSILQDEEYIFDFNQDINDIYFAIKISINDEIITSQFYNLNAVQDDFGEDVHFNNIELETVGLERLAIRNYNDTAITIIGINWIKYS